MLNKSLENSHFYEEVGWIRRKVFWSSAQCQLHSGLQNVFP